MTFEEFVGRRVVQQEGYTWDVEKDAMDWEMAVDGMRTMERKFQEKRKLVDSHLTS
jgi:broad-specificity NMP kinase